VGDGEEARVLANQCGKVCKAAAAAAR
jgi:hypothetical protein